MLEIKAIIKAYRVAQQSGEKVTLATVVHVEGSSYRKPGARMLVTERGVITGAISGGCLEGDALRKAMQVIAIKRNKIVTYDTADEGDTWGIQLGCNGIVHILFEYIDFKEENNAVELLIKGYSGSRVRSALLTLFSLNPLDPQPGTTILCRDNLVVCHHADWGEKLMAVVKKDLQKGIVENLSSFRQYQIDGIVFSCFVEIREPVISCIIVGAGNDAIPLVTMARNIGWDVTLIDGRNTHANTLRFPDVTNLIVGHPSAIFPKLMIDCWTVVVLLTHNFNYDKAVLQLIYDQPLPYIGILGPKKRLERMLDELRTEGKQIIDAHRSKLYGPVGLDIGAETAEEVALSIMAEIKGVMSGKKGTSLKFKDEPIHRRFNGNYLFPAHLIDQQSLDIKQSAPVEDADCALTVNEKTNKSG